MCRHRPCSSGPALGMGAARQTAPPASGEARGAQGLGNRQLSREQSGPHRENPPPPGRNAELLHVCTSGRQYEAQKIGSSVAYKTIGTFLSKERHIDASGLATVGHKK